MTSSSSRDYAADPLIGPLLRVPLQAIRARMQRDVAAAGFDDIGPAHFNILQAPTPEGLRPTEIAARGQMTKQAANRLIRHLERSGYLRLEPDPDDHRARIVRLTDRGWALIATIRATVEHVESEWRRQLGPRRFEALQRMLKELAAYGSAAERSHTRSESGASRSTNPRRDARDAANRAPSSAPR